MNPEAHVFVPSGRRSPPRSQQQQQQRCPVPVPTCVCGAQQPLALSCSHSFCRECLRKEFTMQVVTTNLEAVWCPVCRAPVPDRDLKPLVDAAVFARLVSRRPTPPPRMHTPSPPSSPQRRATVVLTSTAMNVHTLQNPPRTPSPIAPLPTAVRSAPPTPQQQPSQPTSPLLGPDALRKLLVPPQGNVGSDEYICSLPQDFWTGAPGFTSSDLVAIVAASC